NEALEGGNFILINNAYFDEARQSSKGTVRRFIVTVSDPKRALAVADSIDRLFGNSADETRTESFRELAQSQMQLIGNLDFAIRAIVGAAFFALMFSTAAMMMQSVRERTPELAVLKAVGFTDRAVFALILSEAVALCVVAAAFGLGLASLTFPLAAKAVPGLAMPPVIIEVGLACAVLVALV